MGTVVDLSYQSFGEAINQNARVIAMLVLSREIGQGFVIEDVLVTLVAVTSEYAEVSLQKQSGGKKVVATLPKQQSIEACYNTQITYIQGKGQKARFGIEGQADLDFRRL